MSEAKIVDVKAAEADVDPGLGFSRPLVDHSPRDDLINRELSWLAFNLRVLEESLNERHPLLERLRFLSISATNLDEFFMVRVAALHGQVRAGVTRRSDDGLGPRAQIEAISEVTGELLEQQARRWLALQGELRAAGIAVVSADDLDGDDLEWLEDYFLRDVFPVLTPLAIDPAHPFPFIQNLGFAMVLHLHRIEDERPLEALVPLSLRLQRFVRLPGEAVRFLTLEDLVGLFLDRLFPGYEVAERGLFRVIRDSDIEVEEEAEDLVRFFQTALKRRRRGSVTSLLVNAEMSERTRARLGQSNIRTECRSHWITSCSFARRNCEFLRFCVDVG